MANATELLFKKYLKIIDPEDNLHAVQVEDLVDVSEYGEEVVEGITFGCYKVLKFKHNYDVPILQTTRPGFQYEGYECIETSGGHWEPSDYDENLIVTYEYPLNIFITLLCRIIEETINNTLLAEEMEKEYEQNR